jgi:hypothetical protein
MTSTVSNVLLALRPTLHLFLLKSQYTTSPLIAMSLAKLEQLKETYYSNQVKSVLKN